MRYFWLSEELECKVLVIVFVVVGIVHHDRMEIWSLSWWKQGLLQFVSMGCTHSFERFCCWREVLERSSHTTIARRERNADVS